VIAPLLAGAAVVITKSTVPVGTGVCKCARLRPGRNEAGQSAPAVDYCQGVYNAAVPLCADRPGEGGVVACPFWRCAGPVGNSPAP
jgi:hypothetical protein